VAVTIQMGKTKEQEAPQVAIEEVADPVLAAKVDELAQLIVWEAKQKKAPQAVRLAELKKEFADAAAATPTDEPEVVFEGFKNRYKFGKPAEVRTLTVDGKKMFANKVGEEAFLEVANIPLKAIDDYIPKNEQSEYLDYDTGARTGKMEAKLVKK
jgi:hypothetical protein